MAEPAASDLVLSLKHIDKVYGEGEVETQVLFDIELELRRGDFTALMGPSGSGKSTLLNILGLLDRPTRGELMIAGVDATALNEQGRTALRGKTLGFIFQFHHLLPAFSVLENVLMPVRIQRHPTAEDKAYALDLLNDVGLTDKVASPAGELSGGQAQRVAIARALCSRPTIVLADEPTGNLDTASSDQAFALMKEAHESRGCAFVVVTHDASIANRCQRVVELVDGRVVSDRAISDRAVAS